MHKPASGKKGFSLAEVLISLSLAGVLAAMLLPTLSNNGNQGRNANTVRTGMADVANAYVKFQQVQIPNANTQSAQLIPYLNYVRPIAPAEGIDITFNGIASPCDAATPCVYLQTGAILQYDADQIFTDPLAPGFAPGIPPYNNYAVRFGIDPDGTGPQEATAFALFYGGRISTQGYVPATIIFYDDFPAIGADPAYLSDWTSN